MDDLGIAISIRINITQNNRKDLEVFSSAHRAERIGGRSYFRLRIELCTDIIRSKFISTIRSTAQCHRMTNLKMTTEHLRDREFSPFKCGWH